MLPQKVKKGRKNCSILTPAGKFRHALTAGRSHAAIEKKKRRAIELS
jgi:hypothetical protein